MRTEDQMRSLVSITADLDSPVKRGELFGIFTPRAGKPNSLLGVGYPGVIRWALNRAELAESTIRSTLLMADDRSESQ